MKSISLIGVGAVVLIVYFGGASAAPGIFDFFGFGRPPVQTVYVVKPSHGHGHGHHHHGPPPKTIVKYVSQPPSYSGGSGWSSSSSSGKKGKGRKPMSMEIDEETFNKLVKGEESPMGQDEMGGMEEGQNAQMEPMRRPQSQSHSSSLRGMRPPTTMSMMMKEKPQAVRSQKYTKPKTRPSSGMMMNMNAYQMGEQGMNEIPEEMDEDAEVSMSPVKGRGHSSGSSSSSGGWSSGPKTVTYITSGWGSPSKGWGWSPPPSYGWGSPFDLDGDDGWPFGGGSEGWSSGGGGGGWSSGPPGDSTSEMEEEPETGTEGPAEMVDEVGTTEEGEDRRPAKRPATATSSSSGARRPTSNSRPAPLTSSKKPTSVASGSRRPTSSSASEFRSEESTGSMPTSSGVSGGYSGGSSSSLEEPSSSGGYSSGGNSASSVKQRPRPRANLPSTSDPLPEVPEQGNAVQGNPPSEFTIGGQVVPNQDGLLDEELIRTVQQIIEQFDRN